jgi:hypothetical protein
VSGAEWTCWQGRASTRGDAAGRCRPILPSTPFGARRCAPVQEGTRPNEGTQRGRRAACKWKTQSGVGHQQSSFSIKVVKLDK